MFLEREGWRYDRGGRGRRGGGGGGSGGATGPSGGEASIGWAGRPREVLLDGRRGEARLFFLIVSRVPSVVFLTLEKTTSILQTGRLINSALSWENNRAKKMIQFLSVKREKQLN